MTNPATMNRYGLAAWPRRRALRTLQIGAAVGLAFIAACDGLLPIPGDGTWIRHTIADDRRGADGVRLGDVNDDGRMDLVVPWEEGGAVVVYVNPGPEAAAWPWPSVRVGAVASVEDAVFVDLDDDGAFDIVSGAEGSNRTLYVHWAPRDVGLRLVPAAWQTEAIPATADLQRWMFCTPANIDARYGIDLIAGGKDGGAAVGWLEAPANPRDLSGWRWYPLHAVDWTMSVIAADVDRDGNVDILASDRKGDGRGVFWLENPGPAVADTAEWITHSLGVVSEDILFADVGDIDGDGLHDVIAATWGRGLLVYLQQATSPVPWRDERIALPDTVGRGKGVRLADIDLDGQMDAVFSTEEANDKIGVGWLPIARALAGEAARVRSISAADGSKFDLVQVLDLDADGDLDVITTEESMGLGVVWYENPAQ